MLEKKEHLIKPRNMEPWKNIKDMKVVQGKPVVIDKTEANEISERDAADFEGLLNRMDDAPIDAAVAAAEQMEGPTSGSIDNVKTSSKKVSSVVVKVEKKALEVKRKWAILAECDDDSYYNSRRYKGLHTIRDLEEWVKKNICDFEEGKMFETLLTNDEFFTNPGMVDHPNAKDFLDNFVFKRGLGRKLNTEEIGLKVFFRNVLKDVLKEKARGLALRNFEVFMKDSLQTTTEKKAIIGKLLDDVLKEAHVVEGGSGRDFLELDRFKAEKLKQKHMPILTDNNIGSIVIEVYCKDVILLKNKWLISFLEHTSYCWDNVAMMLHKSRSLRYDSISDYFGRIQVEHFNEGIPALNRLLRDATVVTPGNLSITLLTPLNTKWEWNEDTYNINAVEVWHHDNELSDLKTPISLNTMLERLSVQINDDSIRFNRDDASVVFDYQKSHW